MRETISVSNKIRCSKSETTRVGCRGEDHSSLVHHLTLLHRSKQRKQSFPQKNHLCYLRYLLQKNPKRDEGWGSRGNPSSSRGAPLCGAPAPSHHTRSNASIGSGG